MRPKPLGIFRRRGCGGLATAYTEVPMNPIVHVTPQFAVTGALGSQDLVAVAGAGFRSVLSNLPDGELPAVPDSGEAGALAAGAGLALRHLPIRKGGIDLVRRGLAQPQAPPRLASPIPAP